MALKEYDVTVTFTVKAENDCDAENALEYALAHAPLLGAQNEIPRFEIVTTEEALHLD